MSPDLGSMGRRDTVGAVLVALGILLLIAPALAPVQPVLYHESYDGTTANRTMLEQQGLTVISYENLSERGQELYVATLESGGRYTVPVGQGASEFPYPTEGDLGSAEDYRERDAMESIVIERPDDASLPPADENREAAEYRAREKAEGGEEENTPSDKEVQQYRERITRYDMMTTRTDTPPLSGTAHLVRMLALLAGAVAVGTGGYLLSSP